MPSSSAAAAAFAAPHLLEETSSSSSRPTTPFAKMFFKSPAAALKKANSSPAPPPPSSKLRARAAKSGQPRPHTVSGSQLPLHLSSYVSYCAYSSLWDPSVYGAGNPCPPPPRGTLNDSKLAFLDWRMAVIKYERESSSSSNTRTRASSHPLAPAESLEEVLDVIVGDITEADGMEHENALSGRVHELEVDDDVLVRNRKPVQRVSGFAPRPHTSEGIAPTYVPKMPGRFYHIVDAATAENEDDTTTTTKRRPISAIQTTLRPALDSTTIPAAMAKAVILSVHGEDSDDDSNSSTPASTSGSASVSGSNMGSYEGSQWRSSSTFSHKRHRASSSVNNAATDGSERRSNRGGHRQHNTEHAISLVELDRSTRLLEARLAADHHEDHQQSKPLPLPVGQHFYASVPFEHLAPVRESSFTTPQIGHDQQKTPQVQAAERFEDGGQQSNEEGESKTAAPVVPRRIVPRRSKSLLSRAVSRFRPTTPSPSSQPNTAGPGPEVESETTDKSNSNSNSNTAPAAARPSSRLGIFGRESTRTRSRSVGASTALSSRGGSDVGHHNNNNSSSNMSNSGYLSDASRRVPVPKIPAQHLAQQQQQPLQTQRESMEEGACSSSSRPSSRMASVLSLRPGGGFRRSSLPGANPPPSSASAHAARVLNEAARPHHHQTAAAAAAQQEREEQDEAAEQQHQEEEEAPPPPPRSGSSLSVLRSRTPNPFKSSKNWLKLRHKRADSFSHSPAGSVVASAA
ncbi:hypothetical protein OC845_000955 [Tilletia horrida]|nr:hypothetical protein OC845_000955 [Tilletia horrida]